MTDWTLIRLPWLTFEVPPADTYSLWMCVDDHSLGLEVRPRPGETLEEEVARSARFGERALDRVTLAGRPAIEIATSLELSREAQAAAGLVLEIVPPPDREPITRSRHARGPRGEGLRLSCSGDLAQGGADLLARIADRCHFGELEEGAQLGPVGVSGLVATELASASASYRSGESLDLSPFDEETSLEEARAHVERVVRDMRLERLERWTSTTAVRALLVRGWAEGELHVYGILDLWPRRLFLQAPRWTMSVSDPRLHATMLDRLLHTARPTE